MSSLLPLKNKLIEDLSQIDSVIFVGGTSEYIQGFREDLNDIDISISDPDQLQKFGYVFRGFNNSIYGLSGQRAFIKNQDILIDVFVDKPTQFMKMGRHKCHSIDYMLELNKNTLRYNKSYFSENNLEKLIQRINRLESYKKTTQE